MMKEELTKPSAFKFVTAKHKLVYLFNGLCGTEVEGAPVTRPVGVLDIRTYIYTYIHMYIYIYI